VCFLQGKKTKREKFLREEGAKEGARGGSPGKGEKMTEMPGKQHPSKPVSKGKDKGEGHGGRWREEKPKKDKKNSQSPIL